MPAPRKADQSAKRDNPPGKKPKDRSSSQITHDTVLRMRQACEILYPIANGLGMLRAPAASLEPDHLKTLDVIRHFCDHMDMHLEPGAPQGSIVDHLSLLVALVGGMDGGAIPPFPEMVSLAGAISDSIIGGIVLPHSRKKQ